MAKFLVRRIFFMILTMFLVSLGVFFISEIIPLDVARNILGQFATPEAIASLKHKLGLDLPAYIRYWNWLTGFLTGNLGESTRSGTAVLPIIIRRTINSGILAGIAFVIIMPISLILGVIAGLKEGKWLDRVISIGGLITTGTPEFASGVFLILVFALWFPILPGSSALDREDMVLQTPAKLVLPIAVIALAEIGYVARMTRASMAEVMRTSYIRTAMLKGLPYRTVVMKHALRNAMLAPITVMMLHINWLVGGLVVTESVFGFPGLGRMMLDAAMNKDVHLIEAGAMVATFVAVFTQLLADVMYTYLSPRIRFA